MESQFQICLQLSLIAKKMHQQIRWKIATLGQGGILGVEASIGWQNSAKLGLV